MSQLHGAVRIVEMTERLWESDGRRAADRAALIVARLIQTGHLPGTVEHLLPVAPRERPTVAELDAILNSEERVDVAVQPDGSVRATTARERLQDGLGVDDMLATGVRSIAAPSLDLCVVDRVHYAPEDVEHLPLLQIEMNDKEHHDSPPCYRWMYAWHEQPQKWILRPEYVARWGQLP